MCCFSEPDNESNVGVIVIETQDMPADHQHVDWTVTTTTLEHVLRESALDLALIGLILMASGMPDCKEVLSPPDDPTCGTLYLVYKHPEYKYPEGRSFCAQADFKFSKELEEKQMKMLRKNKGYRRIFVLCKKMHRDAVGFSFEKPLIGEWF